MKSCFVILITLSSFLLSLRFPYASLAHTLEKDVTIGAVIHIDPDDDPIVGQQSTIIIELTDTNEAITKENCSCTFKISSEGKTIYEQPLFQGTDANTQNIVIPYTFPRRDVYELTIDGVPLNGGTFQRFSIEYPIRVAREVSDKTALRENVSFFSSHIPHLVGSGIIIIFIIGALIRKRITQ